MNKENILFAIIGITIGFICGTLSLPIIKVVFIGLAFGVLWVVGYYFLFLKKYYKHENKDKFVEKENLN